MSLRERFRRAIHEFTRSDLGPARKDPITERPAPAVSDVEWERFQQTLGRPRTEPVTTHRCCYCGRRWIPPYTPIKTAKITPASILLQANGHATCGYCFHDSSTVLKECTLIHEDA